MRRSTLALAVVGALATPFAAQESAPASERRGTIGTAILLPVVTSAQEPITFNGRPLSSAVEVWTLPEPAAPAPDEPEPMRQGGRPIVIGAVAGAFAGCIIGTIVASDDSGGPGAGTLCAVAGLIWGSIGAGIGLVVKTIRSHLAPSRQW